MGNNAISRLQESAGPTQAIGPAGSAYNTSSLHSVTESLFVALTTYQIIMLLYQVSLNHADI